jgi:NAD+ synthase (glutamine-hydrolysing)
MSAIRVAQAQINVTVGDLAGNLEIISAYVERAKQAGADIVTFPELALCGYPPEDLLLKPRFLRDNRSALEKLAPRCDGIAVLVGFPDCVGNKVYNAAALIDNGLIVDVYHKIELPNYGVFDERRYFDSGCGCSVFDMGGTRFSVTVCEDIWLPGSETEKYAADNHADAVLNISASPFHAGKAALRRDIVARFARVTGTTLFFNNLVGGQDELVFDGGGMVVSPQGQLIASAERFKEDLLLTDIDGRGVAGVRPTAGACRTLSPRNAPKRPAALPRIARGMDRLEEIYSALVLGVRDYVRKNGFAKVVLGLSGGVDSSLTAAVGVDALSAANVTGVSMPSQYTSAETFSDAAGLAANLGIDIITVPIRDIFGAYAEGLADAFGEAAPGVEQENLQARIRANILMGLSNRFGWLVLTTGNKSETAVGYCTLYGDMAGAFGVIKDTPKTLVFELARYVNRKAGREVIPESVIRRPPTAELKPDQKDEDSLPPYAILDPILKAYVEEDRAPDEIVARGYDSATVDYVVRLVHRNEYKRRQAAPGVKITPKAFGKDRRLPITSRYVGSLEDD